MRTGRVDGVDTSEGFGERMEEGNARDERWVEAVTYVSLNRTGEQRDRKRRRRMDEPGEGIGPGGVDAVHEGPTLHPFGAPIAFAIQSRTVEIRTAEDRALGRGEMERGQKGRCRGERVDVRKVSQRGVRHEVLRTQVVEGQVGGDQLAFGPGVERGVCVGAEEGFEGLGRGVCGDDEGKGTGDDGGVVVESWGEHGYAKRRCQLHVKGGRRVENGRCLAT